jgi:hypothetical protein
MPISGAVAHSVPGETPLELSAWVRPGTECLLGGSAPDRMKRTPALTSEASPGSECRIGATSSAPGSGREAESRMGGDPAGGESRAPPVRRRNPTRTSFGVLGHRTPNPMISSSFTD